MGTKCFPRGYSVANFVIQRFSVVGCMRMSDEKHKYMNTCKTVHYIPNRFQQLSVLFMLERLLHLLNCLYF